MHADTPPQTTADSNPAAGPGRGVTVTCSLLTTMYTTTPYYARQKLYRIGRNA